MIRIAATINKYLAKRYVVNFLVLLLGLLSVAYLFDTVELIRRANKQPGVTIPLVLEMSFLKLPEVGQILFPFAILFSAMFTFWQLSQRSELVVVRASGFSVWQFLLPVLTVAVFIGILQMSVINPLGALFISRFEVLERNYLSRQENQIAVFKEGLWLRQGKMLETENSQTEKTSEEIDYTKGYMILHAPRIEQPGWILKDVTVLYFANNDRFYQRVDATQATLEKGLWQFRDVEIYREGQDPLSQESFALPTLLTIEDIEESFSSPESMSFWALPGYINTLEQTGFDATKLRVHYQNLLSQPLLFAAMVLLAATVSLRPPRFRGGFILIIAGVFIGFVVFFLSSFLQALGASGQIPIALAAWSPALICFLLGLSIVMSLEDG